MEQYTIQVNEKFFVVIRPDGTRTQVRRDVYWDTGFKNPEETDMIKRIELAIDALEGI